MDGLISRRFNSEAKTIERWEIAIAMTQVAGKFGNSFTGNGETLLTAFRELIELVFARGGNTSSLDQSSKFKALCNESAFLRPISTIALTLRLDILQ